MYGQKLSVCQRGIDKENMLYKYIMKYSVQLLDMSDSLWFYELSTPGLPVHHQLQELAPVMPSNNLTLYNPLLRLSSILPSIQIFSKESVLCIRPKYWSFSFSISPSNEYSGLTSFRIDWFGLLAVQGTLKSLLQNHSSEASILQLSALWSNSHIHAWLLGKP